jgi:putative nucleotidyltransferase with HDIG domain
MVSLRTPWSVRVDDARILAESLLAGLDRRLRHTRAVARRARELAGTIGDDDADTLVAAAWLHDIGYAGAVHDTGFHPLDGARHLDRCGWAPRVGALVAYHSGAQFVAAARGLSAELAHYPREESALADALTYADQTTGPTGDPVCVVDRMAEMLARHGVDSPHARVHHERGPYLLAVAGRVERRLGVAGTGRWGVHRGG